VPGNKDLPQGRFLSGACASPRVGEHENDNTSEKIDPRGGKKEGIGGLSLLRGAQPLGSDLSSHRCLRGGHEKINFFKR